MYINISKMRKLLIDTDTASDDAVALIMALMHGQVETLAITLVAGNVPLDQGVQNALYTVELCGKQTPVYAGAATPLQRPLETAQFVHGMDGMGDIGLELSGRTAHSQSAIDVIIDTAQKYDQQLELVTLGPLTNIALALQQAPQLAQQIKSCTIMGGVGLGHGNITPVSEYNIWADPEAAKIVFESGLPMRMVGWDQSRNHAWMDQAAVARIKNIDSPLAHFAMDIQGTVQEFSTQVSKLPGFDLPDPLAMAVALDPGIILEEHDRYVEVILSDGLTRGQTVIDHMGILKKQPNLKVVLKCSRPKFLSMLSEALS